MAQPTLEFHIFRGKRRDGELVRVLIELSELEENDPEDFFTPDVKEIEEVGTVQVIGDTMEMGTLYTED